MDIADENAIYSALPALLRQVQEGTHTLPMPANYGRYSRRAQAEALASCMSGLLATRPQS